jgi:hypothetical protein
VLPVKQLPRRSLPTMATAFAPLRASWARSCFAVAAQAAVCALIASPCPFKAEPPSCFPFPLFPTAVELFGPPVKLVAPATPQPASSRLQGRLVLALPPSPLASSLHIGVGCWPSSPSRPSRTLPRTPPRGQATLEQISPIHLLF